MYRIVVLSAGLLFCSILRAEGRKVLYTNHWALEIVGNEQEADDIALKHGFVNKGQIAGLVGYYHFWRPSQVDLSPNEERNVKDELLAESQVVWIEQQVLQEITFDAFERPRDPCFKKQWHLVNEGQVGGPSGLDINVLPVWKQGLTGKGIVVAVLDTGLYHNHPDLKRSYRADVSYDFVDNDPDPMPVPDKYSDYSHGTLVGGLIVASRNSVCGVGVAYDADLGGIRLPQHAFTDIVAATALTFQLSKVDIYSNSWALPGNGKSLGGPGRLTNRKLGEAVAEGRGGLGAIYVISAGNGGEKYNDCNCDGFKNSIYTISITAVTGNGTKPVYTESCSAILAATYGAEKPRYEWDSTPGIYSTDFNGTCGEIRGTSAAAPLASGMIALALQANPLLGWRDVQHIIVRSAKVIDYTSEDWTVNGAGRYVSHAFGYGVLDTEAIVGLAKNWIPVPKQRLCTQTYGKALPRNLATGGRIRMTLTTDGCRGGRNELRYLEHVVARITLSASNRGHVAIHLTSPQGTTSRLLQHRVYDNSRDGFKNWPFMTVFNWGEDPNGQWILEITRKGKVSNVSLEHWELMHYGTNEAPYANSSCHTECMSGCSGPGADQCYGCLHFKIPGVDENYTCVATCPAHLYPLFTKNGRDMLCSSTCGDGWYIAEDDDGKRTCRECSSGCTHCRSASLCLKCASGWNRLTAGRDYREVTKCVRHCGKHYYLNETDRICLPCSKACSTCNGPTNSDCLSCQYPRVLYKRHCRNFEFCPKKLYNLGQSCVANCTEVRGYYSDKTVMKCKPCIGTCASCFSDRFDACIECKQNFYMLNGSCRYDCPRGYYKMKTSDGKICMPCDSKCTHACADQDGSCRAKSLISYQQVSSECPFGMYLESTDVVRRPTCVKHCRTGFYANQATQRCTKCQRGCIECDSQRDCTRCKPPYFLNGTHCLSTCPRGYFKVKINGFRRCIPCASNCSSCTSLQYCSSCKQSLVLAGGRCQSQCPSGFHARHSKPPGVSRCVACHHTCRGCSGLGSSRCTSCANHFYLHSSRCSLHCPSGHYRNFGSRTCDRCHASCHACIGSSPNRCTACRRGQTLRSHQCFQSCPSPLLRLSAVNASRLICVRRCIRGTFVDRTARVCTPCHPFCSSCYGPDASNCITCESFAVLEENRCVKNRTIAQIDNQTVVQDKPIPNSIQQTFPQTPTLDQPTMPSPDQSVLGIVLALSGPTVLFLIVSVVLAVLLFQARRKLVKQRMMKKSQSNVDGEKLQPRVLGSASQSNQ